MGFCKLLNNINSFGAHNPKVRGSNPLPATSKLVFVFKGFEAVRQVSLTASVVPTGHLTGQLQDSEFKLMLAGEEICQRKIKKSFP